jgi:hypothetical protein
MSLDPFVRQQELREDLEESRIQFVLTELDMAATFCDVAKSSTDSEKTGRNIENARKGYDTALKFSRDARFDERSKSAYDEKLARLRALLKELGQQV